MNADTNGVPIRVIAEITRRDIFDVSLRYMLRARWWWAIYAIGFAVSLSTQWHSEHGPTHWFEALYLVVVYVAIWLAFLFAGAPCAAAIMVLQATGVGGVLGSHTFEIRAEGLFESTSANQTNTNWSAIRRAIRTDRYIVVSLAWWLFHCIPRRAFPDAAAYDAFFQALDQRIREATPQKLVSSLIREG
jgi:hypothetical protein